MANTSQPMPLCPICCERPTRTPRSAMCDSCRSEVCKLRQLDGLSLLRTTNRAIMRLKRIIAARLGPTNEVVQTPHTLQRSERES